MATGTDGPDVAASLAEIKRLYGQLSISGQDALRNEFFGWQPRCPRCGTPKYLGSVGCPGPGLEHLPAKPARASSQAGEHRG